MNQEQPVTLHAMPTLNSRRLILVLGLVAMLSGLLIVTVYQATLPAITEQKRLATQAAVRTVIPGAVQVDSYLIEDGALLADDSGGQNGLHLYAGYDDKGTLSGIALEGFAQGYSDTIRILYGYAPACQCIGGFTVVASRETPGFGDKLKSDDEFLANFRALDARLDTQQNTLANPIVTVKHGTKRQPWQIDAISGATVSSRAAGRAVNDSASRALPLLARQLDLLKQRRP